MLLCKNCLTVNYAVIVTIWISKFCFMFQYANITKFLYFFHCLWFFFTNN